jgi:chaperone required for assembly of F1-ATPase
MKRFWAEATTAPTAEGYAVLLDGKPVKLPTGRHLTHPLPAIAAALAAEWQAAGQNFTPDDLPLTRLATTAQERIAPNRADIARQLAAYGMNDLLCYRASEPALAAREAACWQPWLDWAATTLGAQLLSTTGITPIDQPRGTQARFIGILEALPDDELAGLGVIVPALGSLILGLAVAAGALAPDAACDAAFLNETWQERSWGTDDEAAARRQTVRTDVETSARFMALARST